MRYTPSEPCPACGHGEYRYEPVFWPALIEQWSLSEEEVEYAGDREAVRCARCGSNLRSMALALAICRTYGFRRPLRYFPLRFPHLRKLEINEPGMLRQFLRWQPRSTYARYPKVDMQALPYEDCRFDLVVHSDTVEHVVDPLKGLAECCRVLRPGGHLFFTVPIILGRLTASRAGKPPSYHGIEADPAYLVHWEFGADFWTYVLGAGFSDCRLVTFCYPAGLAVVATR